MLFFYVTIVCPLVWLSSTVCSITVICRERGVLRSSAGKELSVQWPSAGKKLSTGRLQGKSCLCRERAVHLPSAGKELSYDRLQGKSCPLADCREELSSGRQEKSCPLVVCRERAVLWPSAGKELPSGRRQGKRCRFLNSPVILFMIPPLPFPFDAWNSIVSVPDHFVFI